MENNLNLSLKVGRYAIALKDGVRINSGIRYFIERIGEYGSASKVIVNGAENDSSIFAEDYEQPLMKRALLKVKSCNSARLIARFSAPKELKLLLGGHSEITITKERLAILFLNRQWNFIIIVRPEQIAIFITFADPAFRVTKETS